MSRRDGLAGAWRRRVWLRACDRVGSNVRLLGRPHVENLGRIDLGDDVEIASRPVVTHLAVGPGGRLTVGRGVRLGHGVGIAVHGEVSIGDDAEIGAFVMIMDTDFHEVGDHAAAGAARPVRVGPGARIGSRVTILRGARIGAGATVVAGSVVSGDVPAGARVAGVPARPVDAGAGDAGGRPLTLDEVRRVVQETLRLDAPPAPETRPQDVEAWDSLGTVNILLSLEAAFGVSLAPADVMSVATVADLLHMVARAARAGRAG
ncbi:MAG: phosphopantetheine-binding protein [Gemmatimonadaceae bacterium]